MERGVLNVKNCRLKRVNFKDVYGNRMFGFILMARGNLIEFYSMSNEELILSSRCAGGRGADPKTTWEEVYQDVLKKIWKI